MFFLMMTSLLKQHIYNNRWSTHLNDLSLTCYYLLRQLANWWNYCRVLLNYMIFCNVFTLSRLIVFQRYLVIATYHGQINIDTNCKFLKVAIFFLVCFCLAGLCWLSSYDFYNWHFVEFWPFQLVFSCMSFHLAVDRNHKWYHESKTIF